MATIVAVVAVFFFLTATPVSAGESRASGRFGHTSGSRNVGRIHSRFGHNHAQRFAQPHFRFGAHRHFSPHFSKQHFHLGHRSFVFPRPFGIHGGFFARRSIHVEPSAFVIWSDYPIAPRYEPRWHAPDVKREPQAQRPLISLMLAYREQLELSPEQVQELEQLRHDYRREAIRADADLRIAEIELEKLLKESPVNLDHIKAKIEEIERVHAGDRFLRIRTIEQGKALLSPEQREKLQALAASEQPRFPREASSE